MQAENNKINIKTLSMGCRLNALESEKIQNMLRSHISTAIVVNTCAVTAEAERQSGQTVRRIARENPNAPIFITGCAATRNAALFADIPNTFVIHNRDKLNISAYADAINSAACHITTPAIDNFKNSDPQLSKQFIQIQNGCNHQCAYCVTRMLRGSAVSFDYTEILDAAQRAVQDGFYEIVLTGVDIASYAYNGMLISDLCRKLLHDVPGIKRLRLSSFDPASPEIFRVIDLMHADARMMPHMHLSMQSGSDTILRAMRRRHNAATIRRIAQYAAGITFSWDIICGFPGETDELFAETMASAGIMRPIKIHAFPFSPRPGTVAADMPGQIDRATSKARVKTITAAADAWRTEFMRTRAGDTTQVLVEENNIARDPHDITVKIIDAPVPAKTVCNVHLTDAHDDTFIGRISK